MPIFIPKPALEIASHRVAPEHQKFYPALKHAWFLNERSGSFIRDAMGNVHGVNSGASRTYADGSFGYAFDGEAKLDRLDLDDVPDFGDGSQFTILSVFSTNGDTSSADPKLLSINDSGAAEKIRLDWNNPNTTGEWRFEAIISASTLGVVFDEAMQQNRFYSSVARFDGAGAHLNLMDWTTNTYNVGFAAGAGTLDSVAGGTATIANATATGSREWGGNIYMICIWTDSFDLITAEKLVKDPYGWLQPSPTHELYRYAVIGAPVGGDIRNHIIPAYMRLSA